MKLLPTVAVAAALLWNADGAQGTLIDWAVIMVSQQF